MIESIKPFLLNRGDLILFEFVNTEICIAEVERLTKEGSILLKGLDMDYTPDGDVIRIGTRKNKPSRIKVVK